MKIKTAVILAGGLGQRIRPVSNNQPKALAPIDGEPMMKKLIAQLVEEDFEKIVVLAGYKGEQIAKFISQLHIAKKIVFVQSPESHTPAERLLSSKSVIGDKFLLLYCDNYIKNFGAYFENISLENKIFVLTEKRDIGNIKYQANKIVEYNPEVRKTDFPNVELGYIFIGNASFFHVLAKTRDLKITMAELSKKGLISGLEIDSSDFMSISNLKRFNTLNSRRHKIILDRDGILIQKMPHREYLQDFSQYRPLSENWDALVNLSKLNFDFVIATNQPGVATGQVSADFLEEFHDFLISELRGIGVTIYTFYVCPHHWNDNCKCRKPLPGMLEKCLEDFEIDPNRTLYIGDESKDREAAGNARIKSLLINSDTSRIKPDFAEFKAALPTIYSHFSIE